MTVTEKNWKLKLHVVAIFTPYHHCSVFKSDTRRWANQGILLADISFKPVMTWICWWSWDQELWNKINITIAIIATVPHLTTPVSPKKQVGFRDARLDARLLYSQYTHYENTVFASFDSFYYNWAFSHLMTHWKQLSIQQQKQG